MRHNGGQTNNQHTACRAIMACHGNSSVLQKTKETLQTLDACWQLMKQYTHHKEHTTAMQPVSHQ
jgi:hypothetical protein